MLGLSLNSLVEMLYIIVVSMTGMMFFTAFKYKFLNIRIIHHAIRMIMITLILVFHKLYMSNVSMLKVILVAETIYIFYTIFSEFFAPCSNIQKKYTLIGYLLAVSYIFIIQTHLLNISPYDYSVGPLVIANTGAHIFFILVKHFKKEPLSWTTPYFYGIFANLTILAMFNLAGVLIYTILKFVYLYSMNALIWQQITLYNNTLLSKAKHIEKDFNDAVRKEVKEQLFYMELAKQKMAKIAKHDNLTKALNKKTIIDTMDKLVLDKRTHVFSILMLDIDNFKQINDSLGHIEGDQCLQLLAKIARASIRKGDQLGRYGGDEFIIVLPNADIKTAVVVSERFRRNIEKTTDPHFTVSIGIASYPDDGNSANELITHADEGLYLSKSKGNNKTSYKNNG